MIFYFFKISNFSDPFDNYSFALFIDLIEKDLKLKFQRHHNRKNDDSRLNNLEIHTSFPLYN